MKSCLGWLVCVGCVFAAVILPPVSLAQYKEIDQIGDEFAKESMKARPETKIIVVADLHDVSGASSDQGQYLSLILTSAISLHMKHKYAVAEQPAFDAGLQKLGISVQSMTTPKSVTQIAGKVNVDAVVIGDFQRDQTYYSVHLSTVRVSDGAVLYSSDSKVARSEFLDSLAEPFPPTDIKDSLRPVTKADMEAGRGPACESCPVPVYTKIAKDVRLQGTVIFNVLISKQGEVMALRPTRILGLGLDEAAYHAVSKTWIMRPARDKDGQPFAVIVPIEVTFALR